MNRISGSRPVVVGQDSRRGSELWPGDLAPHSAGRDSDLRIIPDAFVFSRIASRHHVQLAILFPKPYWRMRNRAVLSEGAYRDVLLIVNLGWDSHEKHCTQTNTACWKSLAAGNAPFKATVPAPIPSYKRQMTMR